MRGFEDGGWDGRVFIALGANLPVWHGTPPRMTLGAALVMLESQGVRVLRRSSWYETEPVPPDPEQANFVNAVAEVKTRRPARDLMAMLLAVEQAFGRVRSVANAARTIDLDLLAYGPIVHAPEYDGDVCLPHPRMCERAFVMTPLAEIAPDWRHPQTRATASEYAAALDADGLAWMVDAGGAFGTEWAAAAA